MEVETKLEEEFESGPGPGLRRQTTFENQLINVLNESKKESHVNKFAKESDFEKSNIMKRFETNRTGRTTKTMFEFFKDELQYKVLTDKKKSELKESSKVYSIIKL